MDLGTVQTTITSWVEAVSGLQLEWGRQPQKIRTGAFILAYAGAISKTGHDERDQSFNGGTGNTEVRVVGVRTFPLTLSFRSFDQRLGESARQYAEKFRTLAHSNTSFQTLKDAEIALVDTGALDETDYVWSGRRVSQVDMVVTLALRANFTDPDHDGSFISTVNSSAGYDTEYDETYDGLERDDSITS